MPEQALDGITPRYGIGVMKINLHVHVPTVRTM